MFDKAKDLGTTNYDAHMMKNIEWGAVAYLAQSQYGRNGTEISVNQCTGYITGAGRGTGTGDSPIYNSSYDVNEDGLPNTDQQYNGRIGKLSSTTGNIYGVYDMSGGTDEYVMGFYGTDGTPKANYAGFTTYPESKYYDLYTSAIADSSNIGDALYETFKWNGGYSAFVDSWTPVFNRGGDYDVEYYIGTFGYSSIYGTAGDYGFRICLAGQ